MSRARQPCLGFSSVAGSEFDRLNPRAGKCLESRNAGLSSLWRGQRSRRAPRRRKVRRADNAASPAAIRALRSQCVARGDLMRKSRGRPIMSDRGRAGRSYRAGLRPPRRRRLFFRRISFGCRTALIEKAPALSGPDGSNALLCSALAHAARSASCGILRPSGCSRQMLAGLRQSRDKRGQREIRAKASWWVKPGQNDNQQRLSDLQRKRADRRRHADLARARFAVAAVRILVPCRLPVVEGQATNMPAIKSNKLAKCTHTRIVASRLVCVVSDASAHRLKRGMPEQDQQARSEAWSSTSLSSRVSTTPNGEVRDRQVA